MKKFLVIIMPTSAKLILSVGSLYVSKTILCHESTNPKEKRS